jgi:hypothetical protein
MRQDLGDDLVELFALIPPSDTQRDRLGTGANQPV